MVKKATTIDYILFQGGKPTIEQRGDGLWHIKHAYREDQAEVVTHISPNQRGTVIIEGVEYQVSLLWRFEGAPCERQSKMVNGEGYSRSPEKK